MDARRPPAYAGGLDLQEMLTRAGLQTKSVQSLWILYFLSQEAKECFRCIHCIEIISLCHILRQEQGNLPEQANVVMPLVLSFRRRFIIASFRL